MFFVSVPQYFSTAPLYPITRRPVDFFKLGVNRVLMDLIGVRFPINGVRFPINCRRSAIFIMMWNI